MEHSSGSSTAICELCKKNNQLYTCPRCSIKYCGLECYKSEAHLDCSESFYKQCVTDELKCQENDPGDVQKMVEILKRIQAADLEEVLEDNEEIDDICNDEDCPLDSDDEELLDLETRLQNVNFENPDELWSVLSDAEKQEFEALLKNGEVGKILPAWTPWWTHSVQKKVIQFNEEDTEDVLEHPPVIDVPLFTELQKASSSVQFNVVNVIYAYAYIALYYYGDYLNCPEDATYVFLMICENMKNNKVFENVDLAIESVIKCIKHVDWLARDEQTLAALREAGDSILSGPVTGEKTTVYISVALSELHRLLTAAKVEISKDKSASVKQKFTKRFPQKHSGDVHLSKKSIFLSLKKLEYYLSYVKSYGSLV